jgi:hypothetical protein
MPVDEENERFGWISRRSQGNAIEGDKIYCKEFRRSALVLDLEGLTDSEVSKTSEVLRALLVYAVLWMRSLITLT